MSRTANKRIEWQQTRAGMAALEPQRLSRRQQAAELIDAVLEEQISPQAALNRWPVDYPIESGLADRSLQAAYQVLWHFEADEEQQQSEPFYLDAQLQLLRQIVQHFCQGKDLPAYILNSYPPEHQAQFYRPQSWWAHTVESVTAPMRRIHRLWRQSLISILVSLGW